MSFWWGRRCPRPFRPEIDLRARAELRVAVMIPRVIEGMLVDDVLRTLEKRRHILNGCRCLGQGVLDVLRDEKRVRCWRGGVPEVFVGCRPRFGKGVRHKADLAVSSGTTSSI